MLRYPKGRERPSCHHLDDFFFDSDRTGWTSHPSSRENFSPCLCCMHSTQWFSSCLSFFQKKNANTLIMGMQVNGLTAHFLGTFLSALFLGVLVFFILFIFFVFIFFVLVFILCCCCGGGGGGKKGFGFQFLGIWQKYDLDTLSGKSGGSATAAGCGWRTRCSSGGGSSMGGGARGGGRGFCCRGLMRLWLLLSSSTCCCCCCDGRGRLLCLWLFLSSGCDGHWWCMGNHVIKIRLLHKRMGCHNATTITDSIVRIPGRIGG